MGLLIGCLLQEIDEPGETCSDEDPCNNEDRCNDEDRKMVQIGGIQCC